MTGAATCPQCNQRLAQADTPAGPALGCDGCNHRWLDADRLEHLQATTERRYTPDDVDALRGESKSRKEAATKRPVIYVRCPGCDKPMLRRTFGETSYLLVNYCADHGFWIHEDELAGIVRYIERGGEILDLRATRDALEQRVRDLDRRIGKEKGGAGDAGYTPIA